MTKTKMIYIEWVDSATHYGWRDRDEKYLPLTITSIGFVLSETEDNIVISTSLDGVNEMAIGPMVIPKCSIKKRKFFKVK